MSEASNPSPAAPVTSNSAESAESPSKKTNPAAPAATTASELTPAQKEEIRKFKLKRNGVDKEVDEKTLIAMAQKGWDSDEKYQQTANEKRRINQLLNRLKSDPDAVLKALGVEDPTELYKSRLSEKLKHQMMTPEQRELAEAKQKLQKYEDERKAADEDRRQSEHGALVEHYKAEYDKDMSSAIVQSGLPKTPRTVKRMAELAYKNLEQGFDLPMSALAEMVRDEYQLEIKELFGQAEGDRMLELFGDDVVKKIQSADLKRIKSPYSNQAPHGKTEVRKSNEGRIKAEHADQDYVNEEDWKANLEKFKNRSK